MENFDKNDPIDGFFKSDLRATGDGEQPEPSDWISLADRLDLAEKASKTEPKTDFQKGATTSFLLLFLVASTGLLFWKMRAAEKAAEALKIELSEVQKSLAKTAELSHEIVVFDTVFQTVSMQKAAAKTNAFLDQKANSTAMILELKPIQNDAFLIQNDSKKLVFEKSPAAPTTDFLTPKATEKGIEKTSEKGIENSVPLAPKVAEKGTENPVSQAPKVAEKAIEMANQNPSFVFDKPAENTTENPLFSLEKSLEKEVENPENESPALDSILVAVAPVVAEPVRRNRPHFSITAGPMAVFPKTPRDVSFDQKGGAFVAFEARFGRHFSLGTAVGTATFKVNAFEKMDPRLLVEPVAPSSSEFVFQNFKAQQRLILPEITASYRFFDSKKWKPRLIVGFGYRFLDTENAEFKFENPATGERDEAFEKHLRDENRGGQWSLRAGLERHIAGHFSAFGDTGATGDFARGQRGFALGSARLGVAFGF